VELKNSVIPVFSSYRFFTSKEQAFNLFKQALNVDSRSVLGEIRQLMLDHKVNHSYIPSTYETLPSKSWLVGFVEAEPACFARGASGGNFFITKEGGKYVHGFSLNVNRDTFILEKIRMMLKIPEEVYPNYNKRTGAYSFSTLKTLNEGALKYIGVRQSRPRRCPDYFNNCFISSFSQESDTLHGGVEFPLWRESLINNRDNQEALKETLNHMRNLRNADVIRSTPQNLAHQLREESLLRLEKDKSLSIVEDKKLRSVIIGILLGNACTERRGNTRLKIVQGIKNQEYLMHLWHLFHEKGLCSSEKPKAIAKPRSKSDPRMYTVLRFYTYARPEFYIYDELFYPKSSSSPNKKVKRVPSNIANFLDFRALAYWLMDCGANTPASLRGKICTHRCAV
jgi:hypothetical protein